MSSQPCLLGVPLDNTREVDAVDFGEPLFLVACVSVGRVLLVAGLVDVLGALMGELVEVQPHVHGRHLSLLLFVREYDGEQGLAWRPRDQHSIGVAA